MSVISRELVEIVDSLPEEKARAVVDFARFLEHQIGDAEWERIIANDRPRPKLDAFVENALREGAAEPLDTEKL